MFEVRDAMLEDAERLLEIYDYYVKNTAITFEYDTPSITEFIADFENNEIQIARVVYGGMDQEKIL